MLSDPDDVEDDFLWAWLNGMGQVRYYWNVSLTQLLVNTRCIFYRLKEAKSDPDNLTLCPILDFANHSIVLPSMTPRATDADIWDMPLKRRVEPFSLMSPARTTTKAGDELYLRYGFHTNQFLFVEYGFSAAVSEHEVLSGVQQADIDITPTVEEVFARKGKVGEWLKEQLLDEGYWGCVSLTLVDTRKANLLCTKGNGRCIRLLRQLILLSDS